MAAQRRWLVLVVLTLALLTNSNTYAQEGDEDEVELPEHKFYVERENYVEAQYPPRPNKALPIKVGLNEVKIPIKVSDMRELPKNFKIEWAPTAHTICDEDEPNCGVTCEDYTIEHPCKERNLSRVADRLNHTCYGDKCADYCCGLGTQTQKRPQSCEKFAKDIGCDDGWTPNKKPIGCWFDSNEAKEQNGILCTNALCCSKPDKTCYDYAGLCGRFSYYLFTGKEDKAKTVRCDTKGNPPCQEACCEGGDCSSHTCAAPTKDTFKTLKEKQANKCISTKIVDPNIPDEDRCDAVCCNTPSCKTWAADKDNAVCKPEKDPKLGDMYHKRPIPADLVCDPDNGECGRVCCAPYTCKNFTDPKGGEETCKAHGTEFRPKNKDKPCDPDDPNSCPSICCGGKNCKDHVCAHPLQDKPPKTETCDPEVPGECDEKCCRPYTCGDFGKTGCENPFIPKDPFKETLQCDPKPDAGPESCIVKCCNQHTCLHWKNAKNQCSPKPKTLFSPDDELKKTTCDPKKEPKDKDSCQTRCCREVTCRSYKDGGGTCPPGWPWHGDPKLPFIDCEGEKQCKEKCCIPYTCETYYGEPGSCPNKQQILKPPGFKTEQKCNPKKKGDCESKCCRDNTCSDWHLLDADGDKCEKGLTANADASTEKCSPDGSDKTLPLCAIKCCHKMCKHFAPKGCEDNGRLAIMPPPNKACKADGDSINDCLEKCCREKDCDHWCEAQKQPWNPFDDDNCCVYEKKKWIEGIGKTPCGDKKKCADTCCKPISPDKCKDYVHREGCKGRIFRGRWDHWCYRDPSKWQHKRYCYKYCCYEKQWGEGRCSGWGDPLLKTFDQVDYTCAVPGEYFASMNEKMKENITVWTWQVNEKAHKLPKSVPPYNLGLAMRQVTKDGKEHTLSWRLVDATKQFKIEFFYDGKPFDYKNEPKKHIGPFTLMKGGKWPTDPKAPKWRFKKPYYPGFKVMNRFSLTLVTVHFQYAWKFMRHFNWAIITPMMQGYGSYTGICGSPDKNRKNDIIGMDGQTCTKQKAEKCCATWLVPAPDTYFDPTNPPITSGDISELAMKPKPVTLETVCGTPQNLEAAGKACSTKGLKGADKEACMMEACAGFSMGQKDVASEVTSQAVQEAKAAGTVPNPGFFFFR